MDAAANRTREGLRVIEDYARFALDDRHLTEFCKRLRHRVTDILATIDPAHRLAARETRADVGTKPSASVSNQRHDLGDLLSANFARVQEALRSLEEFAKLHDAAAAAALEQLRYECYTLQRAVETTRLNQRRLGDATLYVLVDGCASREAFSQKVAALVAAGVHAIQLRDKQLDDRTLLERARALRSLTRGTPTYTIVNDRPDLALLADADGVHVGQSELTVKDARIVVGPDRLIGVSAHSLDQAREAVLNGADYLGVGPVFASATKQFAQFPGLELLRAVAAEIRLPAFAIGGITAENLGEVRKAGIHRIAVSAAVAAAPDPGQAARHLLQLLTENRT